MARSASIATKWLDRSTRLLYLRTPRLSRGPVRDPPAPPRVAPILIAPHRLGHRRRGHPTAPGSRRHPDGVLERGRAQLVVLRELKRSAPAAQAEDDPVEVDALPGLLATGEPTPEDAEGAVRVAKDMMGEIRRKIGGRP